MTRRDDVDAVIHMITDYLVNVPQNMLKIVDIEKGYKVDPKPHLLPESNGTDQDLIVVDEAFKRKTNGLSNENKEPVEPRKNLANGTKLKQSVDPIKKVKLKQICVYPIKSCGAFKISTKWPLTKRGLKFDREWMIVRQNGVALTQKTDTKLCLITPSINVDEGWLEISFPYMQSVKVPLNPAEEDKHISSTLCQSKVCGDRIEGVDCGDEVANWLSDALCTNGLRLIRQSQLDKRKFKGNSTKSTNTGKKSDANVFFLDSQSISLSNQAQFLLISTTTVNWLINKVDDWRDRCNQDNHLENVTDRFRGNLILEAPEVLEELRWQSLRIGETVLKAEEPCTRCQMICIDQATGEKTTEPLRTIAREFQGKLKFGLYLSQTVTHEDNRYINCDNDVIVVK